MTARLMIEVNIFLIKSSILLIDKLSNSNLLMTLLFFYKYSPAYGEYFFQVLRIKYFFNFDNG